MRATVLTAIILISSSFPAAFAGENISAGEISVSRLAEDTDRESRERRETEMLFMANKAYEDGFYDVALSMMERFRKDFPDSGKISHAYLLTGQSYLSQGRYAQAMEVFDSLSSDPKAQDIKDAVCFWTAEAYFKENDFEKAVSFYEKLIRAFPGSAYLPEAYYSLGWTFFQMGRYSQAADSLKDFLEKFPGEPQSKDAAFKLVECFYNLKEYSRLKEAIGSVLKIYSGDTLRLSYLYFYLAESEYYLGDYREAAKNYLKSMRSFQDKKARALANLGLGWSYLKLEKYKDAEDVFSGIDQGDLDEKGLEVLLLGQAVLMSHSNRAYEAKKIYQRLIEISQDPFMRIQAYIGKADAFYSLSDYNEAVEIYQEGLKYMRGKGKQPAEVKALADKLAYNLGLAYVKNNANKLALEAFESVVSGGTDNTAKAEALCRMGDIYLGSAQYEKAEDAYSEVLRDFPDAQLSDYALYQKGLAQMRSGDYSSAASSFVTFLDDFPGSHLLEDAVYSLGSAYFYKGDYNSSLSVLSRFRKEFKSGRMHGQAMFLIGSGFMKTGKFQEALDIFKDICRQYPQDSELAQRSEYEMADCYYKLGRENEAVSRFEQLRAKYPASQFAPDIIWWLGQHYYRSGDSVLARRYFSSLVNDFPENSLSADAVYELGLISSEENDFVRAAGYFKEAQDSASGQLKAEAGLSLAQIYSLQGMFGEALEEYRRLLKDYPALNLLVFPRMAKCYYGMQDYSQAELFYRKALELTEPKDAGDIRFSLAEIYEARNDPDAALDAYLKLADDYSGDARLSVRALLRAARVCEDREDYAGAVRIYEKAKEKKSEESDFAEERIEWIKANLK